MCAFVYMTCMYMCIFVHVYTCAQRGENTHAGKDGSQRSMVGTFLNCSLPHNLELTNSVRVAGQKAHGIHLSPRPSAGTTPAFPWILGIRIRVPLFGVQAACPRVHLPYPSPPVSLHSRLLSREPFSDMPSAPCFL